MGRSSTPRIRLRRPSQSLMPAPRTYSSTGIGVQRCSAVNSSTGENIRASSRSPVRPGGTVGCVARRVVAVSSSAPPAVDAAKAEPSRSAADNSERASPSAPATPVAHRAETGVSSTIAVRRLRPGSGTPVSSDALRTKSEAMTSTSTVRASAEPATSARVSRIQPYDRVGLREDPQLHRDPPEIGEDRHGHKRSKHRARVAHQAEHRRCDQTHDGDEKERSGRLIARPDQVDE